MAVISTYGTTENFVKSALLGLGATETDPNGRFYLDGSMVNVELSNVIAQAIYINEIFRDGQSVTGKYTTDRKAGAVRVLLDTPFPSSSRTLAYGGRQGTDGNGGVINVNAPLMPANDEFMVYLNQVNDQAMIFPDLSKEYVPLDIMATKIAGYSKSVAQDRSASTLAEVIAYAFYRSLNGGENLYNIDDLNAEDAYATFANDINALLDNGDQLTGAFTFATEGRTVIGRPSFINKVFNRKSGIILNGSDLAQEMLKNYDLDTRMSDRDYVGTGYKGHALGLHWQSAPDFIWTLAEKYLGLQAGALSNVYAIVVSFESTAMGRVVDLGVKMIDANEVRGIKAQPLNIWGHEAFRKSFVIGDDTLDNDYLGTIGFTADVRKYPVAPKVANASDKIVVPVFGTDGVTVVGYREVAQVPRPNGDNIQSGMKKLVAPKSNTPAGAIASGTVVKLTAQAGASIFYTVDGSNPTKNSTAYTSAGITVTTAETIKAIAIKNGSVDSDVAEYAYTIAQ
ncbi:MAG: chitobiase/beta-hexosaminidase C-terminal domain-containing protein [Firmicutes bacterium]|nr:chitobiase/beta-hexosaminidase C-terminal domain-containing protein [Candidatus Caballimonas caccae]